MVKARILAAVSLLVAGMVAGCGSNSTTTASIAGKVADGYLESATVFMDKNGNYGLDSGEPSAMTDANGSYTLVVDPADVGNFPIVALAVQGVTIDRDTNLPVANSYLLSMPKDSVTGTVGSNFISPFSTQIREMMETGNYANMQQAMDDLRANLGLPAGTNMFGDYIAGQNPTMHTAAQNMATVMGGQMSQLYGTGGSAAGIDVNRYRGMMGAIFSNISSIKAVNPQAPAMSDMMTSMTATVNTITPGMPFYNMSASFRGGMRGGGMQGPTMGGTSMMGMGR